LKERNWAESAKTTIGGKAASDIDGMKRKLTEKSWRYTDGKRGMGQRLQRQQQGAKQHGKIRQKAAGQGLGIHEAVADSRICDDIMDTSNSTSACPISTAQHHKIPISSW
jgi:hypothetical protein